MVTQGEFSGDFPNTLHKAGLEREPDEQDQHYLVNQNESELIGKSGESFEDDDLFQAEYKLSWPEKFTHALMLGSRITVHELWADAKDLDDVLGMGEINGIPLISSLILLRRYDFLDRILDPENTTLGLDKEKRDQLLLEKDRYGNSCLTYAIVYARSYAKHKRFQYKVTDDARLDNSDDFELEHNLAQKLINLELSLATSTNKFGQNIFHVCLENPVQLIVLRRLLDQPFAESLVGNKDYNQLRPLDYSNFPPTEKVKTYDDYRNSLIEKIQSLDTLDEESPTEPHEDLIDKFTGLVLGGNPTYLLKFMQDFPNQTQDSFGEKDFGSADDFIDACNEGDRCRDLSGLAFQLGRGTILVLLLSYNFRQDSLAKINPILLSVVARDTANFNYFWNHLLTKPFPIFREIVADQKYLKISLIHVLACSPESRHLDFALSALELETESVIDTRDELHQSESTPKKTHKRTKSLPSSLGKRGRKARSQGSQDSSVDLDGEVSQTEDSATVLKPLDMKDALGQTMLHHAGILGDPSVWSTFRSLYQVEDIVDPRLNVPDKAKVTPEKLIKDSQFMRGLRYRSGAQNKHYLKLPTKPEDVNITMSQIHEQLFKKESLNNYRRVLLIGDEGGGRTYIMRLYCSAFDEHYEQIYWLNGSTERRMMADMQSLMYGEGTHYPLERGETAELFKHWITNEEKNIEASLTKKGPILVVYSSLDPTLNVAKYLPVGKNVHVVVVANRQTDWMLRSRFNSVRLRPFTPEECLSVFYNSQKGGELLTTTPKENSKKLRHYMTLQGHQDPLYRIAQKLKFLPSGMVYLTAWFQADAKVHTLDEARQLLEKEIKNVETKRKDLYDGGPEIGDKFKAIIDIVDEFVLEFSASAPYAAATVKASFSRRKFAQLELLVERSRFLYPNVPDAVIACVNMYLETLQPETLIFLKILAFLDDAEVPTALVTAIYNSMIKTDSHLSPSAKVRSPVDRLGDSLERERWGSSAGYMFRSWSIKSDSTDDIRIALSDSNIIYFDQERKMLHLKPIVRKIIRANTHLKGKSDPDALTNIASGILEGVRVWSATQLVYKTYNQECINCVFHFQSCVLSLSRLLVSKTTQEGPPQEGWQALLNIVKQLSQRGQFHVINDYLQESIKLFLKDKDSLNEHIMLLNYSVRALLQVGQVMDAEDKLKDIHELLQSQGASIKKTPLTEQVMLMTMVTEGMLYIFSGKLNEIREVVEKYTALSKSRNCFIESATVKDSEFLSEIFFAEIGIGLSYVLNNDIRKLSESIAAAKRVYSRIEEIYKDPSREDALIGWYVGPANYSLLRIYEVQTLIYRDEASMTSDPEFEKLDKERDMELARDILTRTQRIMDTHLLQTHPFYAALLSMKAQERLQTVLWFQTSYPRVVLAQARRYAREAILIYEKLYQHEPYIFAVRTRALEIQIMLVSLKYSGKESLSLIATSVEKLLKDARKYCMQTKFYGALLSSIFELLIDEDKDRLLGILQREKDALKEIEGPVSKEAIELAIKEIERLIPLTAIPARKGILDTQVHFQNERSVCELEKALSTNRLKNSVITVVGPPFSGKLAMLSKYAGDQITQDLEGQLTKYVGFINCNNPETFIRNVAYIASSTDSKDKPSIYSLFRKLRHPQSEEEYSAFKPFLLCLDRVSRSRRAVLPGISKSHDVLQLSPPSDWNYEAEYVVEMEAMSVEERVAYVEGLLNHNLSCMPSQPFKIDEQFKYFLSQDNPLTNSLTYLAVISLFIRYHCRGSFQKYLQLNPYMEMADDDINSVQRVIKEHLRELCFESEKTKRPPIFSPLTCSVLRFISFFEEHGLIRKVVDAYFLDAEVQETRKERVTQAEVNESILTLQRYGLILVDNHEIWCTDLIRKCLRYWDVDVAKYFRLVGLKSVVEFLSRHYRYRRSELLSNRVFATMAKQLHSILRQTRSFYGPKMDPDLKRTLHDIEFELARFETFYYGSYQETYNQFLKLKQGILKNQELVLTPTVTSQGQSATRLPQRSWHFLGRVMMNSLHVKMDLCSDWSSGEKQGRFLKDLDQIQHIFSKKVDDPFMQLRVEYYRLRLLKKIGQDFDDIQIKVQQCMEEYQKNYIEPEMGIEKDDAGSLQGDVSVSHTLKFFENIGKLVYDSQLDKHYIHSIEPIGMHEVLEGGASSQIDLPEAEVSFQSLDMLSEAISDFAELGLLSLAQYSDQLAGYDAKEELAINFKSFLHDFLKKIRHYLPPTHPYIYKVYKEAVNFELVSGQYENALKLLTDQLSSMSRTEDRSYFYYRDKKENYASIIKVLGKLNNSDGFKSLQVHALIAELTALIPDFTAGTMDELIKECTQCYEDISLMTEFYALSLPYAKPEELEKEEGGKSKEILQRYADHLATDPQILAYDYLIQMMKDFSTITLMKESLQIQLLRFVLEFTRKLPDMNLHAQNCLAAVNFQERAQEAVINIRIVSLELASDFEKLTDEIFASFEFSEETDV